MNETSLHAALSRTRNNLDLVRLLFASMVIYGHSFAVTPGPVMGDEIFYKYTGYYGGDLAIKGFFFISGVLVSSSLIASASPIKYMMARIFRIFPALIVVATLCTYVIGPLVTTKHLGEYLANHETWRYMWRTATLQIWGGQGLGYFNLPGVFTENPYKDTVNAPLWSVGAEFYCYLLLLAVYICTKLDKKIALTLFLLIVVDSMLPEKIIFFWLQQASPDFSLLPFCFAFGTIFAIYQREIQVKTSVLIGALFVGYLLRGGSFAHMFGYVVFFVGILVFSEAYPVDSGSSICGICVGSDRPWLFLGFSRLMRSQ